MILAKSLKECLYNLTTKNRFGPLTDYVAFTQLGVQLHRVASYFPVQNKANDAFFRFYCINIKVVLAIKS